MPGIAIEEVTNACDASNLDEGFACIYCYMRWLPYYGTTVAWLSSYSYMIYSKVLAYVLKSSTSTVSGWQKLT